jgi:hypothetical protein
MEKETKVKKVTKKRVAELKKIAKVRLKLWLKHSTFEEMTVHGSFIRFDMAIALGGYPLKPEEWMEGHDFSSCVDNNEFYSPEVNEMLRGLFNKEYNKWANGK